MKSEEARMKSEEGRSVVRLSFTLLPSSFLLLTSYFLLLPSSFLLLPSFLLLSGCHIERIVLEEPVRDRFVEVDTEDHIVVRLDENATTGFEWTAKCANSFVDIQIEHEAEDDDDACGTPGLATIHLRVRRGFIGPAVVYLRSENRWSGECGRRIKLQLFRRSSNVAGWK